MKKILLILAILSAIITGCEKGLEPEIYGSLSPLTFPATENEYELYTLVIYVPFSSKWPYEDGGTKYHFFGLEEGHVQLIDAPTDIMAIFTAWGAGWQRISEGNFELFEGQGRNRSHFEKIRFVTRTTKIIADLEAATIFKDETFKKQLIGEARMARGWTMYRLLQMFGPVPVITDPEKIGDQEAEADLTTPARADYISTIVADLEYASENLPEAPSDYGRFNKGLALTVLMRLYLNEKDFTNAESVGRDIQALGYSLVDDYASLFREATERNTETIYAISCNPASQGRGPDGNFNAYSWYTFPNDHPDFPGWGGPSAPFMASWEFYYSFDTADERRAPLIDSYVAKDGTTIRDSSNMEGAIINKYPPEGPNAYQGNDIVLARYADVMLMLAEAINENNDGPTQEAIALVDSVRSRANIGPLPAAETSSKDAFNDAILRERGWELYFEGQRLFDLRRHGKWPSAVSAVKGKDPSPSSIYPIPQYALDDGAEQNPENTN
ncbi:MAG: RagB/SusD family nutrient uptake outer membrane protein [Bacteroidales bacterium]|nr:RagB/SusD family nutrient uptake outer membrane protein [Bacteroidales bacterium]